MIVTLTATGALVAGLTAVTAVTASSAVAASALVVQAEAYTGSYGVQTEPVNDAGGGRDVGWLSSGDWMSYANVDLGTAGALSTEVRVSSANPAGGTLEVRADSLTGPVLGSYTIKDTGGWQKWVSQTVTTSSALTGEHTVFIDLHSPQPADFVNVNWFSFTHTGTPTTPPTTAPVSTPMPTMSMPGGTPMPTSTRSAGTSPS